MASSETNFPQFPPPPPPAGKPPPPPPPRIPPPPPRIPPPPPPHITPPPPPPSPDHPTVIVIFFISFGCIFFLAFLAIAIYCFIKKTKKKNVVQEADIIHVDEHLKVKKGIVQGPHGAEAVALSFEDDVHVVEEIKKNEMFVEGKHVKSTDETSSALEEGTSTSSSRQHDHLEHRL
ncbi:hypothetical protein RHMOL_Rhmol11G0139300 [Rhododendron molle]|uniref:Uncharacterized protein n=1 Tax=Rhododendron molle TaxID=49168 RepID=A0ACC0LT28_RHOML|nr:hypothetical protein RHMOL_Rhmol11G0139300 [Rhododendron molle]